MLPSISTDFQKQNTNWDWWFNAELFGKTEDSWTWDVVNRFKSNLLIPTVGEKLWKDENNFAARFLLPLSSSQIGLYANSWFQSDEQISVDTKFGNHALGATGSYGQPHKFELKPYVGYQQLLTRTKTEWGWDIGLQGNLRNYRIGDYTTDIQAETNYDFYERLRNYDNKVFFSAATRFNDYTSDSLSFSFSELNKENYAPDLESITSAKIHHREIKNQLFYNLSRTNRFTLITRVLGRDLAYLTERNTFRFENQLRYLHIGRNTNFGAILRTHEETQDNTTKSTDNQTQETALSFFLGHRFANDDQLDFNFSYVKLQYDTPDRDNREDRDEQRFVSSIFYSHQFSPYLSMKWLAYAYFFHQIYIYKERSGNNNWNQVYKLNPRIEIKHGRFSNTLSTQVLANYTIYDFEFPDQTPRSFVFRQYTFADSLTYRFFGSNHVGAFARIELVDKGTFYKDAFAQRVVQSYDSQFYNFFLMNRYILKFQVRAGYTYYIRREFRHQIQKAQIRELTIQGPYLSLTYPPTQRLLFAASIALSHHNDSSTKSSSYMTGFIRLYYNI